MKKKNFDLWCILYHPVRPDEDMNSSFYEIDDLFECTSEEYAKVQEKYNQQIHKGVYNTQCLLLLKKEQYTVMLHNKKEENNGH